MSLVECAIVVFGGLREVGLGRGAVSGAELAQIAGAAGVPPAALVVQG
jgi:hypothetical protein